MATRELARRLAAMEVVVAAPEADVVRDRERDERERRHKEQRDRLLGELSATMDVDAFIALTQPGATLDGQPIPVEYVRHLWDELESLIQQEGAGYRSGHGRFALHPAVVEALLRHGPPAWLDDGACADCRLPMPYRLHLAGEGFGLHSGARVFERCPECGGTDLRSMFGTGARPLEGSRS